MQLEWIDSQAELGLQRGEVAVCIPLSGGDQHLAGCIRSVLSHTDPAVPILVLGDPSEDPRPLELLERLVGQSGAEHRVLYMRREQLAGSSENFNDAFSLSAPADVVILAPDCVVAAGWLAGLRDAAYSDARVATATTLSNDGSIVSVLDGHPGSQLPQDLSVDAAAAAIGGRSLRLQPRLPAASGHCLLIRRTALELVGGFGPALTLGYGEEVDFSQRCLRVGLAHVLADDVFVFHHGVERLSAESRLDPLLERESAGPLPRALGVARRALTGMSVILDVRSLSGPMTGTQRHVLELVGALARAGELRLSAVLPEAPNDDALRALRELDGVELLTRGELQARARGRADIIHRPFQIATPEDLSFLSSLAERLVVTNQDLISYHNPSYFASFADWARYRVTTRAGLALADRVVFETAHALGDALAEDLIEPARASVVPIGVDHAVVGEVPASPPRAAAALTPEAEVVVCLGTDFRHKNRLFALRVLAELRLRHRWEGRLVLVGPRVPRGSSAPEEAEYLARHPDVAGGVIDLGPVSEGEKRWLLERAGAVLYPTVHEGFGLVPFEALDHGVPCLWAPGTSLSELLPDEAAEIVPWDPRATAERLLGLLRDPGARERNLDAIRRAAAPLRWQRVAEELVEVYRQTCEQPAVPAPLERGPGRRIRELSEDAFRLVGPGGALPRDMERPLLALATHRELGEPMFRMIRLAYRAGYRVRRLRRG